MKTDHYYKIGSSHSECQDYTISRIWDKGLAFACVADGCSSSHERGRTVDFGARILAHTAEKLLFYNSADGDDFNHIYENCFIDRGQIHLANAIAILSSQLIFEFLSPKNMEYALDSTLLFCVANENDAMIFAFGDGVVSVEFEDGNKKVYEIKYSNSAPYYVSYLIDKNRAKAHELMAQTVFINSLVNDDTVEIFDHDSFLTCGSLYVEDYKRISLMSDGVTSFTDSNNIAIPTKDIVEKCTKFRNLNGNFVQNAMASILNRMSRVGANHYDDISIASIVKG